MVKTKKNANYKNTDEIEVTKFATKPAPEPVKKEEPAPKPAPKPEPEKKEEPAPAALRWRGELLFEAFCSEE